MFPLGFVLGALSTAAAAVVLGPQVLQHARPVAKAVLKAALIAMHEAQVQSAVVAETAEDLYAEAKAEVTAEAFAAAMAAAQAKAAAAAEPAAKKKAPPTGNGAPVSASPRATTKTARNRSAVRRSRKMSTNG